MFLYYIHMAKLAHAYTLKTRTSNYTHTQKARQTKMSRIRNSIQIPNHDNCQCLSWSS